MSNCEPVPEALYDTPPPPAGDLADDAGPRARAEKFGALAEHDYLLYVRLQQSRAHQQECRNAD